VTEAKKKNTADKSGADEFLDDLLDLEALQDAELMREDRPAKKVSLSEEDAPDAMAESTDEPEAMSEEDALRDEISVLQDRLMRALAEAENQRKRGIRERQEAEERGGRRLARDILPVFDNMKRALDTVDDAQREQSKALIEGLELTQRELVNVFKKNNIIPIDPQVGDKFDPQLHEALFEAPVPNVKKGHIVQVLSEGFTIAGSLVRPAQVGVSSGG
jgi:molecular chaperone GrpE